MAFKYKGSSNTWGLVAIILHWVLAILLFFQFASGIRLSTLNFSIVKSSMKFPSLNIEEDFHDR